MIIVLYGEVRRTTENERGNQGEGQDPSGKACGVLF